MHYLEINQNHRNSKMACSNAFFGLWPDEVSNDQNSEKYRPVAAGRTSFAQESPRGPHSMVRMATFTVR